MRLLVDAHSLIWAADDPSRLSPAATAALQDPANELLVSAATVWEIAIKVGLGKLTLSLSYRDWMNRAITDLGLSLLPVTVDYAAAQAALPWHHRDPFDRLLIAQALTEGIPIVSADGQFDAYGIVRVW
jgi:PIN domain nuclease of toxin-antitoxin system